MPRKTRCKKKWDYYDESFFARLISLDPRFGAHDGLVHVLSSLLEPYDLALQGYVDSRDRFAEVTYEQIVALFPPNKEKIVDFIGGGQGRLVTVRLLWFPPAVFEEFSDPVTVWRSPWHSRTNGNGSRRRRCS